MKCIRLFCETKGGQVRHVVSLLPCLDDPGAIDVADPSGHVLVCSTDPALKALWGALQSQGVEVGQTLDEGDLTISSPSAML
jgi:hypothetical protein